MNTYKSCILCESEGREGVKAIYFKKIDFSGDLIPVCQYHKDALEEDSCNPFEDEQSDE